MAKKTRVALHGVSNNRGILIDPNATDGARVGKNLYWSDGTLVAEAEIRGGSTTTTTTTGSAVQPTLWSLILNIPTIIKQIVALTLPGYVYFDGTTVSSHEQPLHDIRVESDETLTITPGKQYLIWQEIIVAGEMVIQPGGELVILDEELPEPINPDFTYDLSGNLTQIDYSSGDQKLFYYTGGGDLDYLDFIRDGETLRKTFTYTGGGDLDYITQEYV